MPTKYDFQIDTIKPNTAHGKVLSHIKPGSTVLECGCAAGYMTRFMNVKLRCEVSIVEIDEDAYEKAKQYSERSCRADLMDSQWYWFYQDKRFDYVLFADVLEHLTDPLSVVKKAVNLMKDDGQMIVSIPNICHNDILIRMFYDDFRYTRYGILDEGHLRFCGLNQIEAFFNEAGLKIEQIESVIIQTGSTEQRFVNKEIDSDLMKALRRRQHGEDFQYVITLTRRNNT